MIQWIVNHRELFGIFLGVLVNVLALAYNIYRFCRAGDMRKLSNWLRLLEAAREFEVEAEQFSSYTGLEKLNYVLSRLRVLATQIGYDFDEESMTAQVAADIAFTKEVNADKSDTLD